MKFTLQAENNIAKIENALEDMKKIQLLQQEVGEGVSLLSQGGLDVSTEKVTIESIMNRTEQYLKGIQLDFGADGNGTNKDNQTILDIQVVVHDKNPYIFGQHSEASAVTSKVTSVVVSGDIRPDVKFKNTGSIQYQDYIPKMDPNDPEKIIYITFTMKNEGDAAVAYIRPHGMDPGVQSTHSLYTLYLGDVTYPRSSSHDFSKTLTINDWTDYGFKTFIRQGLCHKGSCYIGLKPIESKYKTNDFAF
ncbi:uncharacterized protein LOC133176179 [Saccostrea echinata]|uniref:uncharacterized protein LOC133176179 n=1 Tax=Saccostrea echinata TaxID=191078 RepID=UPI002A82C852|nr:uncharacterized protein LOC133176179 [Saccostrea echinata]